MAEKTIKIKYIICQRIGLKWKYNSQHLNLDSLFDQIIIKKISLLCYFLAFYLCKKKMHILSLDNPKL